MDLNQIVELFCNWQNSRKRFQQPVEHYPFLIKEEEYVNKDHTRNILHYWIHVYVFKIDQERH